MRRLWLSAVITAAFFLSCAGEPAQPVYGVYDPPEAESAAREYFIIDYKNKIRGEPIPEWVTLWLASGNRAVETLSAFQNSFVFVHANEGSNLRALELWRDSFNAELDFPRLAAARIEERLNSAASYPDAAFGAFYEELIRAASDTPWEGAVKASDFWVLKKNLANEIEDESESLDFMILVTIEKTSFTSQMEAVFGRLEPNPSPLKEQIAAANELKAHFYQGF